MSESRACQAIPARTEKRARFPALAGDESASSVALPIQPGGIAE
jgi:hypothetical protein